MGRRRLRRGNAAELRDDGVAVGLQRRLLRVGNEVDVELVYD
jgi:hypothetical protein